MLVGIEVWRYEVWRYEVWRYEVWVQGKFWSAYLKHGRVVGMNWSEKR
jgi:hypothetical protein